MGLVGKSVFCGDAKMASFRYVEKGEVEKCLGFQHGKNHEIASIFSFSTPFSTTCGKVRV